MTNLNCAVRMLYRSGRFQNLLALGVGADIEDYAYDLLSDFTSKEIKAALAQFIYYM